MEDCARRGRLAFPFIDCGLQEAQSAGDCGLRIIDANHAPLVAHFANARSYRTQGRGHRKGMGKFAGLAGGLLPHWNGEVSRRQT